MGTTPSQIYSLSLHDALPISGVVVGGPGPVLVLPGWVRVCPGGFRVCPGAVVDGLVVGREGAGAVGVDRKSTRLNSSHQINSYAVFCLKKTIFGRIVNVGILL